MNEKQHMLLFISQIGLIIFYICTLTTISFAISYNRVELGIWNAALLFWGIMLHIERYNTKEMKEIQK